MLLLLVQLAAQDHANETGGCTLVRRPRCMRCPGACRWWESDAAACAARVHTCVEHGWDLLLLFLA
jgi:hypothetical protein